MSNDSASPYDAPYEPLGDLLDVLDLTPEAPTTGQYGDVRDMFSGRSQPTPHKRIFGGQALAQCLVAAGRSVDALRAEGLLPHSLHATFLQPGDPDVPLTFVVERLRDSRSFSARRVHALQHDRPILAMMCSFALPSDGLDHQVPMPDAPAPESLPELAAELYSPPATAGGDWLMRRAVDVRHIDGNIAMRPGPVTDREMVWFKALGELVGAVDNPIIHAAVYAYASDWTILEPVLRRHGLAWVDRRLRAASLDHAMWFHRPGRADRWTLYAQESPSAASGRGFGYGHMFAEDGTLIATVAQEGMVRIKE
ncbi:MAG: acyl-CoA thioesterase II [Dermatophilus congolensis]|nr:acyl-CoA thioesterase II [Dermatophilus congolensis]